MLIAYEMGDIMEGKGLGKRINMVRKDHGFTADRLSELCNINATYLRQIEGGTKVPSLPVFINICNALKISPDYLLRDALEDNEVSKIRELAELWESTSPSQQEIAVAMIRAVLERMLDGNHGIVLLNGDILRPVICRVLYS